MVSFVTLSIAFIASAATGGISGVYGSADMLERRIVGGGALDASHDYSFLTNILATVDGKAAYACTGALVAPNVVIAPASCVANSVSSKALQPNQVVVGQGNPSTMLALVSKGSSVDLSKAVSGGGYAYPTSVTSHPGYDSIAFTDNIAALVLSQPLASKATSAKLIIKPSTDSGASYTAVGWGIASATNATDYSQAPLQLPLTVASNDTCTEIWAPYKSLTNSLCLEPLDSTKANVCTGDGLLIKTNGQTAAIAGLLNIVAAEGEVPAYQCAGSSGTVDFFTTFANYVSWLTQVTPLESSAFVSTDSFDYQNAAGAAQSSNDDSESDSSNAESNTSEESELTNVESSESGAAGGLFAPTLAASVAVSVLLLF